MTSAAERMERYARLVPPEAVKERFTRHVEPDPETDCWRWTAATDRKSYGRVWVPYAVRKEGDPDGMFIQAHRVAWAIAHGAWPDPTQQIDHLCRNTNCVYPLHLELVDQTENLRRQAEAITHCPKGHVYSPANTGWQRNGTSVSRYCRTCRRLAEADRRRRAHAARKPPRTRLGWLIQASGQSLTWWAAMSQIHERTLRWYCADPVRLPTAAHRYRLLKVAREIWPDITEGDLAGPIGQPEPLLGRDGTPAQS